MSRCSPTGFAARERTAPRASSSRHIPYRSGSSQSGDTYPEALLTTARLVADRAAIRDWSFAFQSESPTGEPWLGPDILDHLADLRASGVDEVLVCPVGFVSDHLEIRWDIDVEAVERARELDMRLARIEMPNADPAFVGVLAGIVRRELAAVAA